MIKYVKEMEKHMIIMQFKTPKRMTSQKDPERKGNFYELKKGP